MQGSAINSAKHTSKKNRELVTNIWLWVLRIVAGFIFVFPLYYAFLTSIKPASEVVSSTISLWVNNPTLEHYKYVFTYRTPYRALGIFVAVVNTSLLTVLGMVFNLTFSTLAAYSFSKIRFRGHKPLFKVLLMSMMVPGIITMVPSFLVIRMLGLWGNIMGVVLPGAVSVFNVFFLRQFFLTLPDELGESAAIDGANVFVIFSRIYLPMIKPALATVAIFCFQGGWNNFLLPYVILPDRQLVLSTFIRTIPSTDFGQGMAASMVATFPVLIIFVIFQKYFMHSLDLSGLKE